MKFLIIAGFMFVTCCSPDQKPSLSETTYRFIDAFFIQRDYSFAETMTDSIAKLKIKNHVSYQALLPRDTVNSSVSGVCGFVLSDSAKGDSVASYTFSVHVQDRDIFPATLTTGFIHLSRFRREHWKVLDFGYINQNDEL